MVKEIRKELEALERYTEIISVASTYPEDVFTDDPLIYGGAERYILLGLCRVVKVSRLVVQHFKFEESKDDEERLHLLMTHKVYPEWLSNSLGSDIKYLSTKGYDYLEHMRKKELYHMLDDVIHDFRHYKKYVLEYVL